MEKRPAWEARKKSVWLSVKDGKKRKNKSREKKSVELPLRSRETSKKQNLHFAFTAQILSPTLKEALSKLRSWLKCF